MGKKSLCLFVALLIYSMTGMAAGNKFTLVIDAGHGGHDTGAPGQMSNEKDINLKTALDFGKYVERNCPDVKVIYTRKRDVFVPLYERANIANQAKADLFVSIHTNALPNGAISRGLQTYTLGDGRSHATKTNLDVAKRENSVILLEKDYKQHYVGYDPNSPESNIMFEFVQDKNMANSVSLAKMIQQKVCAVASRPDKGVHQSNLAVLRLTSMPACLVELGFITTPDEEQLLNTDSRIDDIAKGLYQAFVQYKDKYDNVTATTVVAQNNEKTDISDTNQNESAGSDERDEPKKRGDASQVTPVFKIQILVASRTLNSGNAEFKGLRNVDSYKEGNLRKYTYGASNDYNAIRKQYKEILDKFPDAFIIAFKNGEKVDVNQAINEFKHNRRNK